MKLKNTILNTCRHFSAGVICLTSSFTIAQTTFEYTGAEQMYIVPNDVSKVQIEVYGAQGGTEYGGEGGYAKGELLVAEAETLYVYVGGQGSNIAGTNNNGAEGGFNGGGLGGSGESGSSGGGASDVRVTGNALSNRVIVAGGGGGTDYQGGGAYLTGGKGGGDLTTGSGTRGNNTDVSTPGTQSEGGIGGKSGSYTAGNGTLGTGGSTALYSGTTYEYGGGGGGGYYGGGGGDPWCSGAGGSSYIGGVTNGNTIAGGRVGNGKIVITIIEDVINSLENDQSTTKEIVGYYNLLGQKTTKEYNEMLIVLYTDGTKEKLVLTEN